MSGGVMHVTLRVLAAGLLGGFIGNAVLGLIFTSPPVHALLYDPALQSALFIEITAKRNIPLSVAGLVLLSIIHGWLFYVLRSAMPGAGWIGKGLFWGLAIWAMYWLFQEWFIYHTLLNEPWLLNALELVILLIGSLVEGLVIAFMLAGHKSATVKRHQAEAG
ncbi:MAG: hypothetical protein M1392_05300 [Gammaproteobacteria bacterium]|nr:hypothetical protein [Gammaproteobacteria bacterium]